MHEDFKQTFQHAKWVGLGSLILLVLIYLASGFYVVKPEQRGVVKRFGLVIQESVLPGIHYRLPWPVESVDLPRTSEVRSIKIHFKDTSNQSVLERGAALLTGDENQIWLTMNLQYTIKNPSKYLYRTSNPDVMLNRIVQATVVSWVAKMKVDDVLTTGRQQLQVYLKTEIQDTIDRYGLGMHVNSVQIQSIEPPSKVALAFKDVASAREDKHKMMQQAKGERNRVLPGARADASNMVQEARAKSNEVVEMAKGDTQRFLQNLYEYKKSRSITTRRMYLETIETIMPKVKKIIVNPKAESQVPRGRR